MGLAPDSAWWYRTNLAWKGSRGLKLRIGNLAAGLFVVILVAAMVVFGQSVAHASDKDIPSLTLTSSEPGHIAVSWTAPADLEDQKSYRLSWRLNGQLHSWKNANTDSGGNAYPSASDTSYTIRGLQPGTFTVGLRSRYNDKNPGPFKKASVEVAGEPVEEPTPTAEPTPTPTPEATSTPAPRPQGTITGLVLDSTAPGVLVATWDVPDSEPIDYRIAWAEAGQPLPSWREESGNAYPTAATYSITGLEPGSEYRVWVRARYEGRSGPFTQATALVESEAEEVESPPATPQLDGTGLTPEGQVILLWQPPSDDSITGYQVLRGPDADNLAVIAADIGPTATTFTDTNPPAGQTHSYALQARSAAGLSQLSNTLTVAVPPRNRRRRPPGCSPCRLTNVCC